MATLPQPEGHGDVPWSRSRRASGDDGAARGAGPAAPGSVAARKVWTGPSRERATAWAYWGGVASIVAGLFVTRLLPCVDYPQHLALSDVARRLFSPAAPEHAMYVLNVFTYNGLFHLIVAGLSTVVPIELAGRLVLAASLVAMAGACVAMLDTLGRPREHACLFLPVLFSFSVGWGFANYVLATSIAAWTAVFVARAAARPRIGTLAVVGALGLACAFAHVLAMLVLCVFATAVAFEVAWRRPAASAGGARLGTALFRACLALLPLAIGCVYCIVVYREQYDWDPKMYRDPTIEGTAPPLWQKVLLFGSFALDLFGDGTDQLLLWLALGVMGWAAFRYVREVRSGVRPRESPGPVVLPFAAMTIAYLATPMVLIGTHLIFPRLGQWLVFGAVLATPRFPVGVAERARTYAVRLGVVAGANVLAHCVLFAYETNDASRVIDELPAGQAATAVIWDPWTVAFRNGTLTHLAAYYGARKHGRWAFAFARYLSVPVRFKPGSQPPWPAQGWEFDGEGYDPRCKYARAFPLVIVKAPEDVPTGENGEPVIRRLVFKRDADAVRLLAHHGRFWAFDTTGLPEDGAL